MPSFMFFYCFYFSHFFIYLHVQEHLPACSAAHCGPDPLLAQLFTYLQETPDFPWAIREIRRVQTPMNKTLHILGSVLMLSGDCHGWTSITDAGPPSPGIRQSTDSTNTIPTIWGVSFTGVCAPLIEGRQEALHMAIFISPRCCRTHSWWTPAGRGRTCSHQLAVWWCSAIASEASGKGHWQSRLWDELALCCAGVTLVLLKLRLKWGVQCQIYKSSQRLSRCFVYKRIQGLILLQTRLTLAFIDKSQKHPLADIFFPQIITCINTKYLWVASEKPSLSFLFICKCSNCREPRQGRHHLSSTKT